MVTVITGNDPASVSDAFMEMILADPDLAEEAFAAVMASWDAGPPSPPETATASPPPAPGLRPWPLKAEPCVVVSAGAAPWELQTARSPPKRVLPWSSRSGAGAPRWAGPGRHP